jgi:aminopeptidase N
MWFGNLVTMEWWDDIWLNEGFARYAEHHILSTLRPEFRSWDKYLQQVFLVALNADMRVCKTHPVKVHVPAPDMLMSIFDTISYAKGSVICRMLAHYIGDDALFKSCLCDYMHKFSYKNAKTKDLLQVMDEKTAGKVPKIFNSGVNAQDSLSVSDFIMPWIETPCYPIVIVSESETTPGLYTLEQRCCDPKAPTKSCWPILVTYVTSTGDRGQFLFNSQSIDFKLPAPSDGSSAEDVAVWFNDGVQGFFMPIFAKKTTTERMLVNLSSFSPAN